MLVDSTLARYRLMVLARRMVRPSSRRTCKLRRSDVDTERGIVKVRRSVVFVPGQGAIIKEPKTAAGSRDVAVPPVLLPALRKHLLEHTQPGASGLLFASPRGNPMRDSTMGRWYYKAREAAGRPDLRFHDLRHTGAVLAAQSGATIAELMHRLGHTTPAAAMRYQHAAAERDIELAKRMSEVSRLHSSGTESPTNFSP